MEIESLKQKFKSMGVKCYSSKAKLFIKYHLLESNGLTIEYFPTNLRGMPGVKLRFPGNGSKMYYEEFCEYLRLKEMI